jgi:hypothetical protein
VAGYRDRAQGRHPGQASRGLRVMDRMRAVTSRFIDGRWAARFGKNEWISYQPQPTHWKPEEPKDE